MLSTAFRCCVGTTFSVLLLAGQPSDDSNRVLAIVNGENITSAQLDAALRAQVDELEQRLRQLRQAALNKLIDNLLIEQAARKAGIDTTAYLRKNVESATVAPEEVDAAYEQSRNQFAGVLPAEAKYRIRRTLEDNRRAAALNALLDGLRRQARISNTFVDDRRAAVGFAAQEGASRGAATADVTIVEFADFECPYCRSAQAALKRILDRWPGRVRLVFRHFPLERHAFAMPAAKAAVCADRQGSFWPFHDYMFSAQPPLTEAIIRAAASESGLNATDFESCLQREESLERVRKDILLGRAIGVAGTPAFFVNQEPIASAAELERAVERLLGDGK